MNSSKSSPFLFSRFQTYVLAWFLCVFVGAGASASTQVKNSALKKRSNFNKALIHKKVKFKRISEKTRKTGLKRHKSIKYKSKNAQKIKNKRLLAKKTRARKKFGPLPKKVFANKKYLNKKNNSKAIRHKRKTVQSLRFDIPVTYNSKVKKWVRFFQRDGRKWYKRWLERSYRYLPKMKHTLAQQGLPRDLAYISMIESGFSPRAVSTASAVGYWQFVRATANRYGLKTNWWLDERRDFSKSTLAASGYLGDLYKMFNSWYLTAAAYNMGEGRMKRLIARYKTRNFWKLSRQKRFPKETREYIPKLIAAMLIAKAPKLYGFRNFQKLKPYSYDFFFVPGGTDLNNLARFMKIKHKSLTQINPELIKGFVPSFIKSHRIRIPKGTSPKASLYIQAQL